MTSSFSLPSTTAVVRVSVCSTRNDALSRCALSERGALPSKRPAPWGEAPRSAVRSASPSRERAASVACTRSSVLTAARSSRVSPRASSGASIGARSPSSRDTAKVPVTRGVAAKAQRPERVSVDATLASATENASKGAAGRRLKSPRLDHRPSSHLSSSRANLPPSRVPSAPAR